MHRYRLQIGQHDGALLQARLLLAVEQLCRAQFERVVRALEDVSQDDLRQLVDEQRRHADVAAGEQAEVAGLQRGHGEQPRAEIEQYAIAGAGIGVGHGFDLRRLHLHARRLQQGLVQRDLVGAGFFHRTHLGPQVVGAQEVVADDQPPARVAAEQMKTGVTPEILSQARRALRRAA